MGYSFISSMLRERPAAGMSMPLTDSKDLVLILFALDCLCLRKLARCTTVVK